MTILASLISAAILVAIACPLIWFVLSKWLTGQSLIIATISSAVSLGIGRFSYAGPANEAALAAVGGVAGSIITGAIIANLWLARATKSDGLLDG